MVRPRATWLHDRGDLAHLAMLLAIEMRVAGARGPMLAWWRRRETADHRTADHISGGASERTPAMASSFADHLRAELDGIETELERLAARRWLIEELVRLESASAAPTPAAEARPRRAAPRPMPAARRQRLPRGPITGKVREFQGGRREPAHGTELLAYLERHEAAARSAKPMANLQSALQRPNEQGEVENTGRNHCRLRRPEPAA